MKVRSAGMSAFSVTSFVFDAAFVASTSARSVTIC
jgi:hypothetical protein